MATHSSILAWRILWTEDPGGFQSMGSERVGHDKVNNTKTTRLHFYFWKIVLSNTKRIEFNIFTFLELTELSLVKFLLPVTEPVPIEQRNSLLTVVLLFYQDRGRVP